MSKQSETQRYHYPFRKQLKNLTIIAVMGIVTFAFGSGLRDRTIGMFFMILSGIYPLVIIQALLQNIKSMNYADIDSDALHTTYLGIFHKHIRWSEIKSFSPVTINGFEGIGINFHQSHKRRGWAAHFRQKNFGYEWITRQGYSLSGQSLTEAVGKHLSNAGEGYELGLAKASTRSTPVNMKQVFKLSDLWTRPNALAWFGALVIFNMLADWFKHSNHALSAVFTVLGLVALGFSSTSLIRYRRINGVTQNKTKKQKPNNDWLT